jgi:hypothetical protein
MIRASVSTAIRVKSGRIEYADLPAFIRSLRRLPDFDGSLTVEQTPRQRTHPQNAYLHAVCFPLVAEFCGQSVEETKRDLMGECWGWMTSPISGREVPVRPHTSEMSVEECIYFIDWLIPWAKTKLEIDIPLPNEDIRRAS